MRSTFIETLAASMSKRPTGEGMSDCGHLGLIVSGEARGLCPLCQRDKIKRLRADNERLRAALNEACNWFDRFRPEWGPGTLPTWFVDAQRALRRKE